jgi:hypothetical protein
MFACFVWDMQPSGVLSGPCGSSHTKSDLVQQSGSTSSPTDSDFSDATLHQPWKRTWEATKVCASVPIRSHVLRTICRYWLDRLYEALNPYFYRFGCRANLALSLIPGADRYLLVVKDWIRHMIYTSDPYKYETTFLTTFMRSAILSFEHDGQEASGYILRAQCMLHTPHPSYIRKDHNVYVMRDLVSSLHGTQPWCLSAGIMFVR